MRRSSAIDFYAAPRLRALRRALLGSRASNTSRCAALLDRRRRRSSTATPRSPTVRRRDRRRAPRACGSTAATSTRACSTRRAVLDALRRFATAGRGSEVRVLLQDAGRAAARACAAARAGAAPAQRRSCSAKSTIRSTAPIRRPSSPTTPAAITSAPSATASTARPTCMRRAARASCAGRSWPVWERARPVQRIPGARHLTRDAHCPVRLGAGRLTRCGYNSRSFRACVRRASGLASPAGSTACPHRRASRPHRGQSPEAVCPVLPARRQCRLHRRPVRAVPGRPGQRRAQMEGLFRRPQGPRSR